MLPQAVDGILRSLEEAGFSAYAVGGCVRDLLLCRTPRDWDVTTSARPEQVMALFAPHAIPTGLLHGTVTVCQGGERFEVTTFRADGVYSDHRHPDSVAFSGRLEDDLARRDFTIGAMAMDRRGEIVDLFGGRDDLDRGLLRCVGDASARFEEDALRIMRLLRFASELDFSIDPDTERAAREGCGALRYIAPERLREEMSRLLCGKAVCRVLRSYPDIIGTFLPEILPTVGLDQKNPHHCYDVWGHTAHAVASSPPDPLIRWTLLFHDLGKGKCFTVDEGGIGHFYGHGAVSATLAEQIMARLRFDNDSRRCILRLVDWHDRDIPRTRKSLRRALNRLGEDGLRQLITVKRADNAAQAPAYFAPVQRELDLAEEIVAELLAEDACFSLRQLAVNGRDMMALGLRGQQIGAMLQHLLSEVLEEHLPNEREILLHEAEQMKEV